MYVRVVYVSVACCLCVLVWFGCVFVYVEWSKVFVSYCTSTECVSCTCTYVCVVYACVACCLWRVSVSFVCSCTWVVLTECGRLNCSRAKYLCRTVRRIECVLCTCVLCTCVLLVVCVYLCYFVVCSFTRVACWLSVVDCVTREQSICVVRRDRVRRCRVRVVRVCCLLFVAGVCFIHVFGYMSCVFCLSVFFLVVLF